jgi:enolase
VNTLVMTLRKGRTVTGFIELSAKAQSVGWGLVAAVESATAAAETTDDFLAHIAVGAKAGQFRCGPLRMSDDSLAHHRRRRNKAGQFR